MNRFIYLMIGILIGVSQNSWSAEVTTGWGNVIVVESSKLGGFIKLGGTVIPSKQVTLNAELPGRVVYIAGKVGDRLDEDIVLVQLDDQELLAKRDEILAQIDMAYSNIENAGVQHERAIASPDYNPMMGSWSTMFNKVPDILGDRKKGVERYANVYSYQAQVEQAEAGLMQAEAQLSQIESKLRDAQTISPFTGTIVKKNIEIGDTVQPGMALMVFADLDNLQVQIDVPTRIADYLNEGMLLEARIDSSNTRMQVEVDQIFPMADLSKHTVKVKLNLPKDIPASPGAYTEISVADHTRHSIQYPVVPKSAILWRGTLPAVFLITADGTPKLRLVRVGEVVEFNKISILSGIKIGDKILAQPKAKGWEQNNSQQFQN